MATMATQRKGSSRRPKELHDQVRQQILDHLAQEQFEVGDRFSTEGELATRFSVSRNTVRRAMETLEQQGYLSRRRGVGAIIESKSARLGAGHLSHPQVDLASSNLSRRLRTIVVLPRWNDDQDGFYTGRFLRALSSPNLAPPLSVEIRHHNDPVTLEQIDDEAVLIIDPDPLATPELRRMADAGVHLIVLEPYRPIDGLVALSSDRLPVVNEAVKRLYALGHEAVGIINHDPSHMGFLQAYRGFLEAHRELGRPIHPNAFIQLTQHESQLPTIDVENVTAWICVFLNSTQNVIEACRQKGLSIPEDVSLVSLDDPGDAPLASLGKTVTAVVNDAEAAAAMVHERLTHWDDNQRGTVSIIPSKWVERDSVAPPRR